jgi:Mrp family chromosome partitioning ATPase/capsular polysaccharide biosynthesis protein
MPPLENADHTREVLRPVLRRWWLVLAIGLIVGALCYVYFDRQPKSYTAGTALFFETSSARNELGEQVDGTDPERAARNEAILLRSREVAAEAARRIGYKGDPAALLGSVSVSPATDTDFLQVAATASTPQAAAALANGFARAYIRVRNADRTAALNSAIRQQRRQLRRTPPTLANRSVRAVLSQRIQRLELIRLLPPTDVRQFEPARPPGTADGFGLVAKTVFGFALGLLFGVGAAFALSALERRIRWSGDVEKLYGKPVLAQVPHARLPTRKKGRFRFTRDLVESFRTLRTNLYMLGRKDSGDDDPARTILVTSAVGGEGKSTVVRNLALAYSEAGARVAVVDADLRNPDLIDPDAMQEIGDGPGLAEVIDGSADLDAAVGTIEVSRNGAPPRSSVEELFGPKVETPRVHPDPFAGWFKEDNAKRNGRPNGKARPDAHLISILGPGRIPPDPSAMLSSGGVRRVLDELRKTHDVVLIDSSPLLPVSDALPLLPEVEGVLVTTRLGLTTKSAARQLCDVIGRVHGTNLLGVVANDVRASEGLAKYGPYGSGRSRKRLLARI